MRKIWMSWLLAAAAAPAMAADVGVSISVDQPGFYGRVDIGRVPVPPVVVYERPVVVVPGPVAVQRQPIYLHVPPGHLRKWNRYCARYGACGQPVYFVQDGWYRDHYHKGHRAKPDKRHHGDRRGRDDDDDRRHGHGKRGRH